MYFKRVFSEEHKRKIGKVHKGKVISQKQREALKLALKGKHNSPNTEFKKGHKVSEVIRNKISLATVGTNNPFYGKRHKSETIEKIRLFHLGKKLSEETKRKMSKSRKGRKFSMEHRRKIGLSHLKLKEKCWNWRGGITPINEKIRKSLEYKLWRKAVFERDNYQCIWGRKKHGNKLQADHIKPFALYPELRFAIDNGRTLCVNCHKTTITYLRNYGKHFKKVDI